MSSSDAARDFLAAIQAAPDGDAPRLVYADWLTQRGDPRGEFIAIQCALAGMGDDDEDVDTRSTLNARQWELFDEHAAAWLDELGLAANEGVFHRGLVEEVNVPFERFQAVHELLERDAVVRALRILGRRDGASPGRDGCRLLLEWPGMRLVRALDLSENYLGPWGVEMLAQAPSLAQLERLDLTRNIVWEGVESLARSPWLANLISLELADNGIADRRVRALARTRQLTALRELGLSNNSLTSAPELTESAPLRSLRMLDLRKNPLDEESRALLLRRFGKRVRL